MPQPPLSDEDCLYAVELYSQYKSVQAAALATGHDWHWIKRRLNGAALRGLVDPVAASGVKIMPGFEVTRVNVGPRGTTVEQQQQNGEVFSVPDGHRVWGVSAFVDAQGREIGKWIKTKDDERSLEQIIAILKEAFQSNEFKAPIILGPQHSDPDRLTIYPIADLHLGLKAVADESGADYDLQIAVNRFEVISQRLFDRSPNSDTALIIQHGDWTHVDDDLALTPTSKHSLQVSDRLLDIVKAGVRLMIDFVYRALQKHRRVVVKVLKGNHDLNAWIALYVALAEHFRDDGRVTIDGGAADYWFFRFGVTLIGAHHGHRLKPEEMAGAMAMECREDWGETLYRLFLHGHLHHLIVKEVLGVRVECLRTLAEVDQHHSGKYGSGKSLISITLHKDFGEDGRVQINLPPVKRRAVVA